ncbi:MAG TPA: hypothetical protein VHC69_16995 [Polyangiaceae bacterium]|nr:hypothetical protein [Polyangiaceae bacterium]
MKRFLDARSAATFAVTLFSSIPARAGVPAVSECLAASDKAIEERTQHHLLAAREQLLICASASCPGEVREECTRRVDDINAAIPSIVFDAKDPEGNDLSAVQVTMDGKVLAERLEGTSFSIDPGPHTFVFTMPGQPAVQKQLILVEGTKDRRETVTLGSPRPASPPNARATSAPLQTRPLPPPVASEHPSDGSSQRLLGWTGVGLGGAGLVVGLVFELQRSSKLSDADAVCPSGTCPAKEQAGDQARINQLTDDANHAGTIAAIGFVAGGVLVAGGLTLVFTAPSGHHEVALAPLLAPHLSGLAAEGRF